MYLYFVYHFNKFMDTTFFINIDTVYYNCSMIKMVLVVDPYKSDVISITISLWTQYFSQLLTWYIIIGT
jgi:hypothetical protein